MSSTAFPISGSSRSTLGTSARAVVASADPIDPPAKAIVLLTAGDITIMPDSDGAPLLAFVGVPAGFIPPYAVRKVTALGSGATAATVDQ